MCVFPNQDTFTCHWIHGTIDDTEDCEFTWFTLNQRCEMVTETVVSKPNSVELQEISSLRASDAYLRPFMDKIREVLLFARMPTIVDDDDENQDEELLRRKHSNNYNPVQLDETNITDTDTDTESEQLISPLHRTFTYAEDERNVPENLKSV
jgi:hypothetical protein